MNPRFLLPVTLLLAAATAGCAGLAPGPVPVPAPAPDSLAAPAPPPPDPRLQDLRLELGAARVLLAGGRPRAARRAAETLAERLAFLGDPGGPEAAAFADSTLSFWALTQVLASLPEAPAALPGTPSPPWWSDEDLARPEVGAWKEWFLGPGAVGLGRWLRQAEPYREDIVRVLDEQGVPSQLWVLTLLESGLDLHARSRSNAVGPWQFVGPTARSLGLLINADRDQRRDWETATRAACRYLAELREDLGDGLLALAAFNCGPSRVMRRMAAGKSDSFWDLDLPTETRNYVPRALALATLVGDDAGFDGRFDFNGDAGLDYETVALSHTVKIAALARVCGVAVDSLRSLNPAWLRSTTPSDGHAVRARVPRGSGQKVLAALRSGELPEVQPEPADRMHRVAGGDTLWGIARRYRVTVGALRRANGLGPGAVIHPGDRLKVPAGR